MLQFDDLKKKNDGFKEGFLVHAVPGRIINLATKWDQ
jgi:hypothetical protein